MDNSRPPGRLNQWSFLEKRGGSSSNLLIRVAAYDTIRQRKIVPIQEIKAAEMETRKRIMVRMTGRDGEEEGGRMNPESSDGIYVTSSVEAKCRFIAQNRKMKEEERIKNTKVNALKRAARTNQCSKSFTKLVANLTNYIMAYEDPSTLPPSPSPPPPLNRRHQGLLSPSWRKDG